MMRKTFLIFILLCLLIASCDANTAPTGAATQPPTAPPTIEPIPTEKPEPLVFTDGKGRTVEIEGHASAIVTLGPSILEGLFAIGAGDQVVGREEYSIYPEEALEITNVGSLWGDLPSEAIVALEPDLVIASQLITDEQVSAIEDLGLTVYWLGNPNDFEGLYSNLTILAGLSGHEEEAETLIDSIKTRVAAVEDLIASTDERPTVFYELDATDLQNPYTTGAGTFIDTLISMAGGSNIGAVLEGDYAQMSSEEIIVQDPEIILLSDAPYGISPESIGERPGWEVISAVVNDKVFPFDPYLVSVPGPRMVDGLEEMAKLLHPELFE
ncbi:MAG: ABC transporter substrate-binding protein [Anaerolineales bacterium]